MMFTKQTQAISSEVLSKEEQQKIAANLNKLGKRSANELSDDERAEALRSK